MNSGHSGGDVVVASSGPGSLPLKIFDPWGLEAWSLDLNTEVTAL